MEYRNGGNASHLGKGLAVGVDGLNGVEIQGSSISAISDSNAADLYLSGKGTGGVLIGGSTTPMKIVAGESTMTAPAMSSVSQAESTFTASGISTGDLILCVDFRNTLSTSYLPGLPYVGAADKIHVPLGNCHNSSISASTGVVVRWAYLDRT